MPAALEGAGGGKDGGGAGGASPSDEEMRRRALWVERQGRRNELRVAVLTQELGLSQESQARVREALATSIQARVELYERLDGLAAEGAAGGEGGRPPAALTSGLDEIRTRLDHALGETLGEAGLAKMKELDAEGKFALPEEKKKP